MMDCPSQTSRSISIHVPLAGNVVGLNEVAADEVIISIHVPLAGNVVRVPYSGQGRRDISIHVPLAGNVSYMRNSICGTSNFYPRSPCGERPLALPLLLFYHALFLSTFPLRGTSYAKIIYLFVRADFYPRSPCGERLRTGVFSFSLSNISIHVPLAGNVITCLSSSSDRFLFLSTFPLRGTSVMIWLPARRLLNFYPRSPCGERLAPPPSSPLRMALFLSTFPLRGTSPACNQASSVRRNFYPRSPCGERQQPLLCKSM